VSVPPEQRPIPPAQRVSDRRDVRVVAVTVGIVAFLVIGVLKPWTAIPSQSATPSASAAPVVALNPAPSTAALPTVPPGVGQRDLRIGRLDPGTYAYTDVDGQGFNVGFIVPAGWTWHGRYLSKGGVGHPGGAAISFFGGPVGVYADPCDWAGSEPDQPIGRRVGDRMAALAAEPPRNAATPIDRPAAAPGIGDRWPGMALELTVPDINLAGCDEGQFRRWGPETNARPAQGPGQHDYVWAVDIPGAGVDDENGVITVYPEAGGLIIDAASFPSTPADVMAEVEAILGSIVVGHWG